MKYYGLAGRQKLRCAKGLHLPLGTRDDRFDL